MRESCGGDGGRFAAGEGSKVLRVHPRHGTRLVYVYQSQRACASDACVSTGCPMRGAWRRASASRLSRCKHYCTLPICLERHATQTVFETLLSVNKRFPRLFPPQPQALRGNTLCPLCPLCPPSSSPGRRPTPPTPSSTTHSSILTSTPPWKTATKLCGKD